MNGRKILFFGKFNGFEGGIERYAFQTAELLRRNGAEVDWCGDIPGRNEELFRKGFDRVFSQEELFRERREYDLAAIHKLPDPAVLRKLRERFGERLVFWAHDHDLYCPRRHFYTPFGRINCHRKYSPLRCALCARICSPRNWKYLKKGQTYLLRELGGHHAVVLSGFMRDNLIRNGFSPEKIHLLPPVIEIPETVSVPADGGPLKILFLGQLIRGKGADLLLDALRQLTIPWHAKLAGDGSDRPMLEARVRAAGLAPQVEFTSWLTDPGQVLDECDAAVFPSRWQEPFGLSGAEASAHGKPVVAFDVGGVREWLADGVTGFAVPEKDTAAMAEKLELLYRDPQLRLRLGSAGRERIASLFSPAGFLSGSRLLIEKVSS